MTPRLLADTFKVSIPVMFGYVPLGIAFGIMFTELGYTWIHSTLMGLFVFAGSAQFLSIGMLAMGETVWEIGLMTFILNSRQSFYGISLLKTFRTAWWKKLYLIFTLSDEPYSLISSTKVPDPYDKTTFYAVMSGWTHFYWVVGCAGGGLLSNALPFNTAGMDFALTALFIVLAIEQYKKVQEIIPFVVAFAVGGACLIMLPKTYMLISSIALSITFILMKGKRLQWAK